MTMPLSMAQANVNGNADRAGRYFDDGDDASYACDANGNGDGGRNNVDNGNGDGAGDED